MSEGREGRMRIVDILKAALPGLGLVLIGILATAYLVRGWGLHGGALRQAHAMAPYIGMPLLVVGVYVAIERITNAPRSRGE